MSGNQTYESYYKAYFKTKRGRLSKLKAQAKYRAKLKAEQPKTAPKKWNFPKHLKLVALYGR